MERIDIRFTCAECDLILNHTYAEPELTDRLKNTGNSGKSVDAVYSLEELDLLAEHIAAEANHCKDKNLEKRLEKLYDRISDIEAKYD